MTTTWDFPFDSLVSLDRLAAGTNQRALGCDADRGQMTRRSYFDASSMPRSGRPTPVQIATPLDVANLAAMFCDGYG
jgi:hypothetical protein